MAVYADVIARLRGDNKDLEAKLAKSKKSVNDFSSRGSAGLQSLVGAFGKIAPAIGLAMGGYESFNKLMSSSQAIGDTYAQTIAAAKASVDNFFYAIGSGDFSGFVSGLSTIAELARDATISLDSLGNASMSLGYFNKKLGAELATAKSTARNTTLDLDTRRAAAADMSRIITQMDEQAQVYRGKAIDAVQAMVRQYTGAKEYTATVADIERIFALDITAMGDTQKTDLAKQYKQYLKDLAGVKADNSTISATGMYMSSVRSSDTAQQNAAVAQLTEQYKDAILYNALLNKMTDESLQQFMNILSQSDDATRAVAQMRQEANEVTNSLANAVKESAKQAATVIPEGSIAYYEAKLKEANTAVAIAATAEARAAAQMVVDEIKLKLAQLRNVAPTRQSLGGPSFSDQIQVGKLTGEAVNAASDFSALDDVTVSIDQVNSSMDTYVRNQQNVMQVTNQSMQGINGLSSAFSALGSITDESTSKVLNFIAAAFQSIAAFAASATAAKADANAQAEDAAAKAMNAHAGIPFAGVALGIASVATMIATLMSLPKFAEGGIVNKATLGVFGEAGPEAIIPIEKLKSWLLETRPSQQQRVEFRIKDSELVGVLNQAAARRARLL